MAEARLRKACSNCYEKKVKCEWPSNSGICSRCLKNSLNCVVPEPRAPNQRSSMRDLLFDVEQRVRNLEQGSRQTEAGTSRGSDVGVVGAVGNSSASLLEIPAIDGSFSTRNPLTQWHSPGSTSSWPWMALRDDSYSTLADPASEAANETLRSIAEEELSEIGQPPKSVNFDILGEFPLLSEELVWMYAKKYAEEAPFAILSWMHLREIIRWLLQAKSCQCIGQLACTFMYLAFGCSRAQPEERPYSPNIFFQRAWRWLPDLLLAHDLWSLKSIVLMVHWLQGACEPGPCSSLLAAASRMATSFALDRDPRNAQGAGVELEEARRAALMCYIFEQSFSTIFNRHSPMRIAHGSTRLTYFAGHQHPSASYNKNADDNGEFDEEGAIEFFYMLRQLMNELQSSLHHDPELGDSSAGFVLGRNSSQSTEVVATFLHRWRDRLETNGAIRPKLRKDIIMLASYHAVIVLDRQLSSEGEVSHSAVEVAKDTIFLITEYARESLAQCIWMWLHYLFAATVVIFLHILANPLNEQASLYLALLSDVQNLCNDLSRPAPGAQRIAQACAQMEKLGFEMVKWHVKRKALKRGVDDDQAERHLSRRHPKSSQNEPTNTEASSTAGNLDVAHTVSLQTPLSGAMPLLADPPLNFSWDEWDEWLQFAQGNVHQPQNG